MRYLVPLGLVIAWQVCAWLGLVDLRLFSSPERIGRKIVQAMIDGSLPQSLAISLWRALQGLLLGIGLGVLLGVLNGLWRVGEQALDSTIQILRSVPVIALTSLFIVWFGFGELPKVLLIAMACFFPMYVNVFAGVRNVDNRLMEMARSMDAGYWQVVRHVLLPSAMPQALVGLRFALTISLFALFVAETINASSGIGYLIIQGQQFGQPDLIFMCLIIYALLGVAADMLIRFLERRLLAWRTDFQGV